jgi:hypothetical protein
VNVPPTSADSFNFGSVLNPASSIVADASNDDGSITPALTAPSRCYASDPALRVAISDMGAIDMNSFIFEMIYCKSPIKNAANAMAKVGIICAS